MDNSGGDFISSCPKCWRRFIGAFRPFKVVQQSNSKLLALFYLATGLPVFTRW